MNFSKVLLNKITNIIKNFLIFWRSFSIRTKIFFSFFVIIFTMISLVNFCLIKYQEYTLKKEIYNRLKANLENFNYEIVDHIVFFDPLKLDEKVKSLMHYPGIRYVMIADLSGRIIAHSNRKELGNYIKVDKDTFLYWEKEGRELKEINLPIFQTDYPLGIIRIGISKREIEDYVKNSSTKLRNYIFLISLFTIFLTVAISYFISNTLTRPLLKLKEKLEGLKANSLELCENENLILCKDFYECDEENCPAFGKTRCWLIFQAPEICKKKYNLDCHECYVYKVSCGDEIGYLIETFNEMLVKLKRAFNELKESTLEKLKLEKRAAIAEMALIVAHEVKNPLNSIKAATNYLKNNFKGKILNEFLSIIDKEVNRLNDLVNSFLFYAKPLPLKLEKNDINKVIKEVINLIKAEFEKEGKIFRTELDLQIPEFYFDAGQIKQVLLNLLINAEEATKKGDTIFLKTKKENNFVKIIVKDTGIGISEENLKKIFEPFFTTKSSGSGLGLACVERIIKEHGGEIEVKSEINKGTEFVIKIPLKCEA